MSTAISVTVSPSQLKVVLAEAIRHYTPLLITGAPGIGKSDIVWQAADAAGIELDDRVIDHPVVSDPTEKKGFPMRDGDHAAFIPFEETFKLINATRPTLWFIDDFGQALPAVQASYMQPLLTRRIGNDKLSDMVVIIAATNRRGDKAGVTGLLEPVKSRFVSIVELEANLDDWCNWAWDHDMPEDVIGFIRSRPGLLHSFDPTADLTNSPSPRTWAHVARVQKMKLPFDVRFPMIAGAVGKGPAAEFQAFAELYGQIDLDRIFKSPATAPIPSNKPSALYAIAVGLAARADEKNFDAICTYSQRLSSEGHGEICVLTLRDAVRRNPKVCDTAAFRKLATSEVGQMFTGQPVRPALASKSGK